MPVTISGTTGLTANNSVFTDASGNVGIGTSSPTAPLDVKVGTGNFTVGLQGAGNALLTASATMQLDAAGASSAMVFKVTGTERGRFDSNGNLLFNSGYGSAATAYGCRAWVNFDGTTATIRASGNVTSVTRSSAGVYVVNFTNAMPDANYAAGWMTSRADCIGGANGTWTTTQIGVRTRTGANIDQDTTVVGVCIFR